MSPRLTFESFLTGAGDVTPSAQCLIVRVYNLSTPKRGRRQEVGGGGRGPPGGRGQRAGGRRERHMIKVT